MQKRNTNPNTQQTFYDLFKFLDNKIESLSAYETITETLFGYAMAENLILVDDVKNDNWDDFITDIIDYNKPIKQAYEYHILDILTDEQKREELMEKRGEQREDY